MKTLKAVQNYKEVLIVSGASDGEIKIWNLFSMLNKNLKDKNLTFDNFIPDY